MPLRSHYHRRLRFGLLLWMSVVSSIAPLGGCRSRGEHRQLADIEVADIIQQRECDPLWDVPDRPVYADPKSRMADLDCPDCGSLPPDDPAAHSYMHCADCRRGWPCWHDRGDLPSIEFSDWKSYLSTDEEGVVVLTRQNVIEMGLLHSREYQLEYEQLYFSALSLTLNRFEFDHQWFGQSSTFGDFNGTGPAPFGSRALAVTSSAGFAKNFTTGAQLVSSVANSLVWEFTGDDISMASSGLLFSLTQPLLRGAFREVRMEPLTQAERNVLYALRDFARFRREFYVNVVGANGYLGLLAVSQSIKNQRANLESLERNLDEHEKLVAAGLVAPIQVDQIFQQYQQGRLGLLQAEQGLEAALDRFKLRLGLPPQTKVRLDDDALQPFELNANELDELSDKNEALRLSLVQYDKEPSAEFIQQGLKQVRSQLTQLAMLKSKVNAEWKTWDDRLQDRPEPTEEKAQETFDREKKLSKRLKELLDEIRDGMKEDVPRLEKALERIADRDATNHHRQPGDSNDKNDKNGTADEPGQPARSQSPLPNDDARVLPVRQRQPVAARALVARLKERAIQRQHPTIHRVGFEEVLEADDADDEVVTDAQDRLDDATSKTKEEKSDPTETDKASDDTLLGTGEDENDDADSTDEFLGGRVADGKENSGEDNKPAEYDESADDRERRLRIEKESPWEALQELVGQTFRKHLAELFVVQTQIRVYLIAVSDLEMDSDEAVARALENRLDLKNQRAVVVDTHRQVEVAADALEADLDVRLEASINTDPNRTNPTRFDASANSYRAGLEFDSPLNRRAERNQYRTAQIVHQRARRDFMALKDRIAADIREDIRSLRFNRFRFDIARLQLIVAARQVDEAQLNLRNATEPDSSFTRDLLNALQRLLDSKNNLIQSWVNYETSRMDLFRDLEQMNIASDGTWLNEYNDSTPTSVEEDQGAPFAFESEFPTITGGANGSRFDQPTGFRAEPPEPGTFLGAAPLEPLPAPASLP